jgi:hypothetical protein
MYRTVFAVSLAVGCAPTVAFNQSFLTPEQLKVAPNGYVSLKSTGETIDLGPIQKEESARADRVEAVKVHGTFVLAADGWKHVYKLYNPSGDEVHYKPIKLEPGDRAFVQPALEVSGNCALLTWQRGGSPAQAYVNADGDVDERNCPK